MDKYARTKIGLKVSIDNNRNARPYFPVCLEQQVETDVSPNVAT